jgi:hypothetical protein
MNLHLRQNSLKFDFTLQNMEFESKLGRVVLTGSTAYKI